MEKGCRCGERLRAKAGGGERLAHTRQWIGKVYIVVFHESVYVWVSVCDCGLPLALFQVEFRVLV